MILNYGSLNVDHVYQVPHFVRPGETLTSLNYQLFGGGKGANQSIALAKAGADVRHAGKLGKDGQWLRDKLDDAGVDTGATDIIDSASGHAIIQVNAEGENCIILHGGANLEIDLAHIDSSLAGRKAGDLLLLQNEINPDAVPLIMAKAKSLDMKIVINPAPMNDAVLQFPLDLVDVFVVNEVEGEELTAESKPETILDAFLDRWPASSVVLTLGSKGVMYADRDQRLQIDAEKVEVVDTTAAGDTFIGYFLACRQRGDDVLQSLQTASKAAAICVTRSGAADAIPAFSELI